MLVGAEICLHDPYQILNIVTFRIIGENERTHYIYTHKQDCIDQNSKHLHQIIDMIAILLSAFKYINTHLYIVKMIVHKPKKNSKQAYQTSIIYIRKILHFPYETITNKNKSV